MRKLHPRSLRLGPPPFPLGSFSLSLCEMCVTSRVHHSEKSDWTYAVRPRSTHPALVLCTVDGDAKPCHVMYSCHVHCKCTMYMPHTHVSHHIQSDIYCDRPCGAIGRIGWSGWEKYSGDNPQVPHRPCITWAWRPSQWKDPQQHCRCRRTLCCGCQRTLSGKERSRQRWWQSDQKYYCPATRMWDRWCCC